MSAFMVESETINKIVNLLDTDACFGASCRLFMPMTDLENTMPNGHPLPIERGAMLGRDLRELNLAAVACRYPNRNGPYVRNTEPFEYEPRRYTHVAMFKAAQCWIYQCSEGDQFTGTEIYQTVKTKMQLLAQHIVMDLQEYKDHPWG